MKAWKKSLLALLTVLLLTSLCGCTKGSSAIELDTKNAIEDSVVEQLIDYTNTILSEPLQETSYEDFVMFRSMGQYFVSIPFDTNFEKRWGDFTALHGDIVTAECTEAEAEEGGYVSHIVLTGEDGQMMRLNVTFDDSMRPLSTTLEPYADDGNKTTGEKMAEAGMNTLIGLGVVFGVLILLTLVISAMKYVNIFGGKEKKEEKKSAPAPAAAPAPVRAAVPETDNAELIAVIAAAIAAAENTTTDAFVVRSIRRTKENHW